MPRLHGFPFTQIDPAAIGPRISVIGYVKVGGLEPRLRYTKDGRPWRAPTRYTDPVRFEITTREQVVDDVKGKDQNKDRNFKVSRGYRRDDALHKAIGAEHPTELEVRFAFPKATDNFVSFFAAHSGKKYVCMGDGVRGLDIMRGDVPCPCPRLAQFDGTYEGEAPPEGAKRGQLVPCRPRGALSFILPEAETFLGFHAFKTTSYESIANLRTQLAMVERQFGRVDGIPFRLLVYPATKGYGDGEGTTTQPIVTLIIPASFDAARQLAADASGRSALLLPGGGPDPAKLREELEREAHEEAEAEAREFYSSPDRPAGDRPALTMEERLAKKAGRGGPLPVVEGKAPASSAGDDEPDHEIVTWSPPDVASSCAAGLEESHAEYLAALEEAAGDWSDFQTAAWQEQKVGHANTTEWGAMDFELATLFLRRGDTSIEGEGKP